MCILFRHRYIPQIIFVSFFLTNKLYHFSGQSEEILGVLCMQLLLQLYSDSFDTLQVLWSWFEYVHIVWIYSSDYFCFVLLFLYFFHKMNFIIFSSQNELIQSILCNSSYSLMLFVLKLFRYLGHDLKICIYSLDIILLSYFCHFFHKTSQSENILGIMCIQLLLQFEFKS